MTISRRLLLASALAGSAALAAGPALAETQLSFFYPIAVGGPVTKIVDAMVADFEKANPGIKIKSVYAGSYQDTIAKILTALKGGDSPQVAVLLSTDMFTLIDEDAVIPYDELVKGDEGKKWFASFYPGFMQNSQANGKTWGIPFQRSTVVLYWNKEAFKEAGLDPEKPPQSWEEMRAFAQKLTKRDASGNVTQWGIEIPSGGAFPYWLFQGLTTENDAILMNQDGTKVAFDKPAVVEALQYWVDLGHKDKVAPSGLVEWGTTPKDFFEKRTAMMWTTTGNLTNVRDNAKFPFGVAMLPAKVRRGTPTGGGNLYVFKKSTAEQQAAALKFVQFMTSPEQAARWSMATGYIAVSPAAFETPALKEYVTKFPPAAVARDQLPCAVAELSTHDNQRVTKVFNDNLQAALLGTKTPAQALKDAQAEADRILKAYQ
ncbi:carbohydrate ABC transporter substrate-binding protein, CUT1 family (TC 3.A.1.1.-) [Enhydrobacter aerosaccus]|uniref:Carbohydrate ABC transporter substrate-binding protein, CUT1 family (TC 3.A.1.1.-) n=1 Tax=Enhydrobacter aerosaccus TaxID=225324 RepID=A0A1T4TG16_9HYPH|nr:ABC transporter substrate-binding protein [Enhydrobacter aerosaccus]SKA39390.1 carbohydrate ABC transporter substrate-binding protein, CUT1 family (TC 3.A.1.1.-) [Enhydrobacter aerosaccus]